jgi:hypothetical protein
MRKWIISISFAAVAVFTIWLPATFGQVPLPTDIPKELSQEYPTLSKQRADLLKQRSALEKEIAEQRSQCSHVNTKDTAQVSYCKEWLARLNEQYNDYVNALAGYKSSAKKDFEPLVKNLEARLERDKDAIRKLGLQKRVEEFEEWENLAIDAREQYEKQVQDSLIDLFFTGALEADKYFIKRIGSLNEYSSRKLIKELYKNGIKNKEVLSAIHRIGAAEGKLAKSEATLKLIEELKKEGDLFKIFDELYKSPLKIETYTEAVTTILGWGLSGPFAGFLKSDVKFMFSSVYCLSATKVSESNIEALTEMTEKDLKLLKELSENMKATMKKLKSAKQVLNDME